MPENEIIASTEKDVEWVLDPVGYFLIRVNREKKQIEVAFCPNQEAHHQGKFAKNLVQTTIAGTHPQHIRYIIAKKGFISRLDHAMSIGEELEKAYIALKYNLKYVQDDELKLDVPFDKDTRRGS